MGTLITLSVLKGDPFKKKTLRNDYPNLNEALKYDLNLSSNDVLNSVLLLLKRNGSRGTKRKTIPHACVRSMGQNGGR